MPSRFIRAPRCVMLGDDRRPDLSWLFQKAQGRRGSGGSRQRGVLTAVASGEKPYGVLVDFMAFNAKAKGSPIDFIFPAEGVPAVTEPVAMLKTAQNLAAARAFIDFILSDEGQKLALSMGYIPSKASVGTPSWLPPGTVIKLMPTDIGNVVQNNSANLKRFAELFGN
jgi:iron(III) transport system substrate-binding protein